jgi:hypothetical protein
VVPRIFFSAAHAAIKPQKCAQNDLPVQLRVALYMPPTEQMICFREVCNHSDGDSRLRAILKGQAGSHVIRCSGQRMLVLYLGIPCLGMKSITMHDQLHRPSSQACTGLSHSAIRQDRTPLQWSRNVELWDPRKPCLHQVTALITAPVLPYNNQDRARADSHPALLYHASTT